MEFDFIVKGRTHHASPERIIDALRDVPPEPPTPYMVVVEGTPYPLVQVIVDTFGVGRGDFAARTMANMLTRLGFEVREGGPMASRPHKPPQKKKRLVRRVDTRDWLPPQVLEIPEIVLQWSHYERWEDIANPPEDDRPLDLPPAQPGVYEVTGKGEYRALYIGRARDLHDRITNALVKGTLPHHAGLKIRENENLADLEVRWAVTDRPAAAEEELHRQHREMFDCLPLYTSHT